MLQDFFDKYQAAFFMFAKSDIVELFDLAADFFTVCEQKFARVLRNCRSQIESNDIEKKSAANSILITRQKIKKCQTLLIQFGDVCNVKAQTWSHFFKKNNYKRARAKTLN